VVALRRGDRGKVFQPSPNDLLQAGDNLIIASSESAIPKLIKGV
jgi:trk system potassium uptake protein TrkA